MSLTTRQLTPNVGVEIHGLDLSQSVSNELMDEIKELFVKHQLLYFGQQQLSPEMHVAFGNSFGSLQVHVMNQYHESEHPELYRLSNIGSDGLPNGKVPDKGTHEWHTDASWQIHTGQATIIYCELATSSGGETLFCDMYGAYERLSDTWKDRLKGKHAIHSLDFSRSRRHNEQPMTDEQKARTPSVEHPIFRTHPESQRKSVFLGDHAEYIREINYDCLLYTSPSPRDAHESRMPSSA